MVLFWCFSADVAHAFNSSLLSQLKSAYSTQIWYKNKGAGTKMHKCLGGVGAHICTLILYLNIPALSN